MTKTEQRAASMGARHKRAGLSPKDHANWRPEVRAAYLTAYEAEDGPKRKRKPTAQQKACALNRWRVFSFYRYL